MHARLFGLPAGDEPLPTALDALLQATHTATSPEQKTAVLHRLADQLGNAAYIIERYHHPGRRPHRSRTVPGARAGPSASCWTSGPLPLIPLRLPDPQQMTTSPDSDHTLYDMDAPVSPKPEERLLALAGLYTQHNDRIDLWLHGRAVLGPDAYAASARHLERATYACITTVRKQRLPSTEPMASAVVRLKQIAHLTGGATRYLTTAQPVVRDADAKRGIPGPRRRLAQCFQLARELTALAAPAIIDSATCIAHRLPVGTYSSSPATTGLDSARRDVLVEVARGRVTAFQTMPMTYVQATRVDSGTLRDLEAEHLVCREPGSAPSPYYGGAPYDRVRLTALGITALSTAIRWPTRIGPPAARPALPPAPAWASTRAHR
ncbi:hypothetical protein [Streptomyces sp. NPDC048106]|uniref:hypothetical protein n=1 Tax=Streptomyces sp. NPDC048106 TaxID=3155750 RepID=UPI003455EC29